MAVFPSLWVKGARSAPYPLGNNAAASHQKPMDIHPLNQELDRARDSGVVRDIVIPPCPELLQRLRAQIDSGDPDPAAVAQIASEDVAMAAALLKVANSSLYVRHDPCASVGQAIAVLGVRPTVTLLTGFLLRNAIALDPQVLEHFWESSTRRALAMGHIARELFGMDAELAKTCGLFFHVGVPVMLQGVAGYRGTLIEALARQDRTFIETENAAHHTDHAVVGAIVARTWKLPQAIVHAVRLHHDFAVLADQRVALTVRQLVAVAAIADHLVARHEGVEDQREWLHHGDACCAFLQIGPIEVEAWVDQLYPAFESVVVA